MTRAPVVPITTLMAEVVAHFDVKGKIRIVDKEAEGKFCRKEVQFNSKS